jgi:hypothetical protein
MGSFGHSRTSLAGKELNWQTGTPTNKIMDLQFIKTELEQAH